MSDIEKYSLPPPGVCISIDDQSSFDRQVSITPPPIVIGIPLQTHKFSEGGLKAHLNVLGAFIALFCTFGQVNAFGTFQSWYASHQLGHMPASTISWIGSLQLWIFFFSGAPIGRLFDAHGPTWLMIAGSICCITSMMTTSVSTKYYQYILSQGVLFGLGTGLLFYPSLSSITTHFSKHRATALGIAIAGTSVGGVVYPVMLEVLFDKVGFGWAVRISGFITTVGCLIATLTVSSLLGRKKPGPYIDIKTFRDTRFVLLAVGSCFVTLGLFIPFFYIVDYAKYLSISDHMSFYVLAVMNAGSFLGRVAPAFLSNKVGHFNLLIPSAFFSGLSCVVFWLFTKSLVSLMLFSVVYGFFSGAFVSLVNPCVAQISDIGQIGTRLGMLYSIISFPSLLGGPTAGALLAHNHGSFTTMIIFSGLTVMVGSFFILASKLVRDDILARV